MKPRNKWLRYFNIILGIPNNKPRAVSNSTITIDVLSNSAEPSSRHMNAGRDSEVIEGWQLKADFDRAMPQIQNCNTVIN